MFLKSLSLQGFKSFAGRTTLELPPGVAAVVGPNGSGKSNIADAIRWVLGEQSVRLLRGTKLEDVIFAGSESKRSVGMAEVSLTFDNSRRTIPLDYAEVTVTRRVYRSGESEFFINRSPCRLRDIQELFLDTGLGRGSLSIIGQGEVDAILSARPEERRAFLEEAAGVSKYRVKKREALVKLAQTEENLLRVGDIIQEVESRLEPLARQAEAAAVYESLERELASVEVTLLSSELAAAAKAVAALERDLEEREKERRTATGRLETLELKIGELTATIDALDEEIEALRERAEAAKASRIAAQHRGEMAKARIVRADEDEKELLLRLQALKERKERLATQLQEAGRAFDEAEGERLRVAAQLTEVEGVLARSGSDLFEREELLARMRRDVAAASERLILLASRAEALEREAGLRDDSLQATQARLEAVAKEHEEELAALTEAQKRLAQVEAAYEKERQAMDTLAQKATSLRLQREEVERKLVQIQGKVRDLSAKRAALADMEAAREGYHRGVRTVLNAAKSRGWGLLGAVAELIQVSKELETAIEVALGAAAQHVVAERDVDAKEAILYLKERRAGRATFLPLNTLRVNPLSDDVKQTLRQINGAIGVASELVDVDEKCRPAIEYLLGRVVVAQDLDAAMAVSRRTRGVSRIVTLDGDLVVPGGAMTGGSRPTRSEGLIGRSRQLEELAVAIAAEKELAEQLAKSLGACEEQAEALRKAMREGDERRRRLEIERLSAQRDVQESQKTAKRLEKERAGLEQSLERMQQEAQGRTEELTQIQAERAALVAERDETRKELERLEEELRTGRGDLDDLRRRAEELRLTLAGLNQRKEERAREQRRLEAELEDARTQDEAEKQRLLRLEQERREAKAESEAAARQADAAAEAEKETLKELEAIRSRRKAVRDEADALAVKVKEAQAEVAAIGEACARIRIELERRLFARDQIVERLRERGIEDAGDLTGVDELSQQEAARLKARARSLRRQIEELGPVNMAAIEEYEEVKKRYAFLTEQRDDLLEAKRQLDQVIARLDTESVEKLQAVFARVRAAFAATFARLFGGGRADLELVDPSDPLESGIEIFVQPPGKRLQNLLALSGGEKALAAIALLFALLEVKPSPFCVLDEIDAALDEHNLGRFGALLTEYAQNTQFIVITHRQPTMEVADSLFGVTMAESGVSTLVSLKLEEAVSAS